jgi:hypothetical protein
MLADVTERVEELMEQGMTLEQVIAARPNAELDESLGNGFIKPEKFIQFIYGSLAEETP